MLATLAAITRYFFAKNRHVEAIALHAQFHFIDFRLDFLQVVVRDAIEQAAEDHLQLGFGIAGTAGCAVAHDVFSLKITWRGGGGLRCA